MAARIKAVFLDAGGTLFKPHPSVGEVYAEVAERHGLKADPGELEKHFRHHWKKKDGLVSLGDHLDSRQEREWWRSLVEEVFSNVGRFRDFEGFFDELYDRFASAESWRLFPDTEPLLRDLKARNKIVGIVSNWDSRLFGICEGLGLTPRVDFILASAVVGAAKPHSKIFLEALRRAGVRPEEALHVGDSYKDDILGAQGVGIQAVLIDRTPFSTPPCPSILTLQFLLEMTEA